MQHKEIIKALKKIRVNAEWTLRGDFYEGLEWLDVNQTKPTKLEIDAAIEAIKQEEIQAEADAQAKKATAEAKLAALGLTAEDLKALGL